MRKKTFVTFLLLLCAGIGAIIPAWFVIEKTGGMASWEGVPPHGVTDSLYYYARIREVVDGHPRIGNPYVYEYRDTFSPAFFLPDILTALPLYLGFPLDVSIVMNVFVWSAIFLIGVYVLLRVLRIPTCWALLWSLITYIGAYSFMLRPTVMQTTYAVLLLFYVALAYFLFAPAEKKRMLILAGASALTFYFYSYLSFVVFLTLAFLFLRTWFTREVEVRMALFRTGIYTGVLLIPFGIYSYLQMQGPLYQETLIRLGLVHTRIPSAEAFFFGRWIIIGLCVYLLIHWIFPKNDAAYSVRNLFWVSSGAGLFGALFLNVVTGVELTLAVHVGRFVIVWMSILLCVLFYEWYTTQSNKSKKVLFPTHAIIGCFILLLTIGVVRNIPRALAFFEFDRRGYPIAEVQAYAKPLAWLEENVSEESVIWSNLSIGSYVPILTKHYTLFHNGAALHNVSNNELEERYLLWNSLGTLTLETVKNDFPLYAGGGPVKDQPLTHNREVQFCGYAQKLFKDKVCNEKQDEFSLKGDAYFSNLLETFAEMQVEQSSLLQKYSVDYLIVDVVHDTHVSVPERATPVYDDGRFKIYTVAELTEVSEI